MSPKAFKSSLALLDLKQQDFAKRLGVRVETVSRWANGKLAVPIYVAVYLEALFSLKKMRDLAREV